MQKILNKEYKKLFIFCVLASFILGSCTGLHSSQKNQALESSSLIKNISENDQKYLNKLYIATFDCIDYFVHPETGFPYDVSDFRKPTSISNIGLYMADLAIASQTDLLSKKDALKKLRTTFTALEKIDKWHGFPITWVNTETVERAFGPSFSYADHIGNLVSSLLVVSSIFPQEFKERIDLFISAMDFASTYDEKTGWLKGGYHLDKQDFDIKQTWGNWYYNLFACDTRHFSLLGIATEKIPENHWAKLHREQHPSGKLDKEILSTLFPNTKKSPYYAPGFEGGGIFMQYLPGIFISEKKLPIGISAKNFAYTQIIFSKEYNYYPFWGISACESPDGKSYFGWAHLKKDVVTPHASILAIDDYPKEVLKNLSALEKNGMRPSFVNPHNSKKYDFGFTDSFNITSKKTSKNYLILDQSMIFLSLANFLYNDIVRKNFKSHPLGKKMSDTLIRLEKKHLGEIISIDKPKLK